MSAADAELLDEFCDSLWLEDGLARNTLDSYRRDLTQLFPFPWRSWRLGESIKSVIRNKWT